MIQFVSQTSRTRLKGKILGIDEFEQLVTRCRKADSPRLIGNDSFRHASILVKELIISAHMKNRKEPIRLLVGCLQNDFYTPLAPYIKEAMEDGCPVSVIVLDTLNEELLNNEFYSAVDAHEMGEVLLLIGDPNGMRHSIVIGKRAYRLESDDVTKKAKASFNSQIMASSLVDRHDGLLKKFNIPLPVLGV